MNWIGDLINSAEIYLSTKDGQIVLTIIVMTTLIGIILNHLVPAFGRFIWRIPNRLRWRWQMFKNWFYWIRHRPDYSFTPLNPAIITEKIQNELVQAPDKYKKVTSYKISIDMRLLIKNKHDTDTLFLDCAQGNMSLRMYSKTGKKAKYKLGFSSPYTSYKIPAQNEETFDFVLTTYMSIDIKPKLGNEAYCDEINIGIAQLSRINHKIKGEPFDVDVDWSKC